VGAAVFSTLAVFKGAVQAVTRKERNRKKEIYFFI
jgi:hypothetical protein